MTILIIESFQNLSNQKKLELLRDSTQSLFYQGHDYMIVLKEREFTIEHFKAQIVLAEEKNISFAEIKNLMSNHIKTANFLGLVSYKSSTSAEFNTRQDKIKCCFIDPEDAQDEDEEIINWFKVFRFVSEYFNLSLTG